MSSWVIYYRQFQYFLQKLKLERFQNKNLSLVKELNSLRNIAVDEDIPFEDEVK